jgi:hypothetical protein
MYTKALTSNSIEPRTCEQCSHWQLSDRTPGVGYCPIFDEKTTAQEPAVDVCKVKYWEPTPTHPMQELWGEQTQLASQRWVAPLSQMPQFGGSSRPKSVYHDCDWAIGLVMAIGLMMSFAAPALAYRGSGRVTVQDFVPTCTATDGNCGPGSSQGSGTR